jgi:SAM-dependent methyltransferase
MPTAAIADSGRAVSSPPAGSFGEVPTHAVHARDLMDRLVVPDERLSTTVASYDSLAERYAERYATVDMSTYYDLFLDLVPSKSLPVLDLGCGSGRDCAAFERLNIPVIGLDLSFGLLSLAANTMRAPLVQADLRCTPFRDGSFGGVWACASMVHLDPDEFSVALADARRVVAPGGALFISVASGSGQGWRPDGHGGRRWFQYYSEPAIRDLVERNGFDIAKSSTEPGVATGTWVNVHATRAGRVAS